MILRQRSPSATSRGINSDRTTRNYYFSDTFSVSLNIETPRIIMNHLKSTQSELASLSPLCGDKHGGVNRNATCNAFCSTLFPCYRSLSRFELTFLTFLIAFINLLNSLLKRFKERCMLYFEFKLPILWLHFMNTTEHFLFSNETLIYHKYFFTVCNNIYCNTVPKREYVNRQKACFCVGKDRVFL